LLYDFTAFQLFRNHSPLGIQHILVKVRAGNLQEWRKNLQIGIQASLALRR
jgi:hypothetical protein